MKFSKYVSNKKIVLHGKKVEAPITFFMNLNVVINLEIFFIVSRSRGSTQLYILNSATG